jgi:hypothetical protein
MMNSILIYETSISSLVKLQWRRSIQHKNSYLALMNFLFKGMEG